MTKLTFYGAVNEIGGNKILLEDKVMDGTKTESRRLSKQTYKPDSTHGITNRRYQKAQAHIQILKAYPQRLLDVTEEQAKAEGFNTLTEFLEYWTKNIKPLIPWQTIKAYKFQKIKKDSK